MAARAIGLEALMRTVENARARCGGRRLARSLLDELQLTVHVHTAHAAALPAGGPLIVVANHPFGIADGMGLHDLVRAARPDACTMAFFAAALVPEFEREFILVDPRCRPDARRTNVRPLRVALRRLAAGNALAMFPSGSISRFSLTARRAIDPPWSRTLGGLVRLSGATVVPVYFAGTNSWLFHLLGLAHRGLRMTTVVRELLRMHGAAIDATVGAPVDATTLLGLGSDTAITGELRRRTYALAAPVTGRR